MHDEQTAQACFLISPIGESESDIRVASDLVRDYLVKPAMKDVGLDVVRAEEIDRPGYVTSHIVDLLRSAPLVVADLSKRNPNVYYELGVRHCFDKPTILISQQSEGLPADLVHQRVVFYETTDPRALEQAVIELTAIARSALDGDSASPVAVAGITSSLRTGSPSETALAEIMATITDLRSELGTSVDRLDTRRKRAITELTEAMRRALDYLSRHTDLPSETRHAVGGMVLAAQRIIDEFGDPDTRSRVARQLREARAIFGAY